MFKPRLIRQAVKVIHHFTRLRSITPVAEHGEDVEPHGYSLLPIRFDQDLSLDDGDVWLCHDDWRATFAAGANRSAEHAVVLESCWQRKPFQLIGQLLFAAGRTAVPRQGGDHPGGKNCLLRWGFARSAVFHAVALQGKHVANIPEKSVAVSAVHMDLTPVSAHR